MYTSKEALEALKKGNADFASGGPQPQPIEQSERTRLAQDGQTPWAVVLGCSDSRVPVETIFHQTPGSLFVIRVAGHVATPATFESIEFAVTSFGSPLIVVLGHSNCGAVGMTLGALQQSIAPEATGAPTLATEIAPSINPLLANPTHRSQEELIDNAVRAHIDATCKKLLAGSECIRSKVEAGELQIVGCEYHLSSGIVSFPEDT